MVPRVPSRIGAVKKMNGRATLGAFAAARFVVKEGAMTFLEAALNILAREGKPLHFKELTERALGKKLLTFVGRTPEVTMQTQLTAAVKKAPGNPFVRVKPGVFGLLRYPELPPEEPPAPEEKAEKKAADGDRKEDGEGGGRGRRRRRRGGRGRGREDAPRNGATESAGDGAGGSTGSDDEGDEAEEPVAAGGLSAEARAAALAETGVLEGDDDDSSQDDDEGEESMSEGEGASNAAVAAPEDEDEGLEGGAALSADAGAQGDEDEGDDADGDDEGGEEAGAGGDVQAGGEGRPGEEGGGRRRRRRRRRRGGGGEAFGDGGGRPASAEGGLDAAPAAEGSLAPAPETAPGEPRATDAAIEADQGPRRIMTPVDAAVEVLRGQAPGRGVHVRQIAETAARRRLVHGEPNEAWRVMRAALAAEPRERLRAGQRPRLRAAGAGLFSLARRPPDAEVERAELVFGEARRALRERTLASLERRIAELPPPSFEALARVLLQREGFGPATFVKRIEETIYVEALRGRGARPSKVLIALRSGGSTAGRRSVGELRAGIVKRGQEEGLLMLAGRLGDDAVAEWKRPGQSDPGKPLTSAPPIEIADGQALAETCIRHGIGVISATVNVDFVDADFFSELSEG
jgi:hypothetical protein